MKKYEIVSFHPGRQHNFEQAYQLYKSFDSFQHLTSLYFDKKQVKWWENKLPSVAQFLKRRSAELPAMAVDTNPIGELKILAKRSSGKKLDITDFIKRNEAFQKWVLKKYSPPKICIGFDTSSWTVFEAWKGKSFLVLDLSIATPHYKLKLAKQNNFSAQQIQNLTKDDAPLYSIYEKELALADMVLCGSNFVKDSCISAGIDVSKLVVQPYGLDINRFLHKSVRENATPLKVVFVGTVSFRKGADIALEAWKEIAVVFPNAELHFYGGIQMDVPKDFKNVFFHGFLPQDKLISELKTAQISILPTFFEGSSLAIYQSMALGLAVITTPNAGSIIESGKNGLLINYGSVDELRKSLSLLLSDAQLRKQLVSAAQTDIQSYTWDHYGKSIAYLMNGVLRNDMLSAGKRNTLLMQKETEQ